MYNLITNHWTHLIARKNKCGDLQYGEGCEGGGDDVDGVRDVDQGGAGVLQGRPGLDGGRVDVEDEDVEDHGQHRHQGPAPQAHPDPPGLACSPRLVRSHGCL